MDIHRFTENTRTLTGSYGIAPYSLLEIPIDEQVLSTLPEYIRTEVRAFSFLIAILIWTDYHIGDYRDHMIHSTEYDTLEDSAKERFLAAQLKKTEDPDALALWVENQGNMALGIIAATASQSKLRFQVIPPNLAEDIVPFFNLLPTQRLFSLIGLTEGAPTEPGTDLS